MQRHPFGTCQKPVSPAPDKTRTAGCETPALSGVRRRALAPDARRLPRRRTRHPGLRLSPSLNVLPRLRLCTDRTITIFKGFSLESEERCEVFRRPVEISRTEGRIGAFCDLLFKHLR